MFTGCGVLQLICAIIIVLLIIITVMLLVGVVAGSSSAAVASGDTTTTGATSAAGWGVAGVLIWAGINIGITALFMKIYSDCAKRQKILNSYELSTKPKKLDGELDNLTTAAAVGVSAVEAEELSESPVVESTKTEEQ
jgi:hypothetical protein